MRMTSSLTAFPIFQLGGAVARVGDADTAFHGRGDGFTININATTETAEGFAEEREWSRNFWTALKPYHTNVYVNFLMEEGEDRVRPVRAQLLGELPRALGSDHPGHAGGPGLGAVHPALRHRVLSELLHQRPAGGRAPALRGRGHHAPVLRAGGVRNG